MKARYLVITLLMLGLYVWAATRQREVAALPDDFAPQRLLFPVSVGAASTPPIGDIGSTAELQQVVQRYPIGTMLRITVPSGRTHTAVAERAASTPYLVISGITALFFWLVSLVVFAPRIDRVPARDLYWACILYGLAVTIGDVHSPHADSQWGILLPGLRVLSLTILPVLLLHVSVSFPVRRHVLDRFPRLIPAVIAFGLVIAAWHIVTLSRYFSAPSAAAWAHIQPPKLASTLFLALVFSSGCLVFLQTSRMSTDERQRDQAKWILWGITVGAAPFVLFHTLPNAWGAPSLPVEAARLFALVIPAAFTFAVVRYKFLDIDVIIRRSVLYFALALFMVAVYFVLGVWLGNYVEARFPSTSRYIPMVAAIVPVLLFQPTRRFVSRWIDRTFFKIRFDHERALSTYVERINTASSQAQLANSLHALLSANLGPASCGVIVSHGDYYESAGNLDQEIVRHALDALTPRFQERWQPVAALQATSAQELNDATFPERLVRAGISIAAPLGDGESVSGIVLLGEKTSTWRYVDDELEFLSVATRETSKCLEYVKLIQRIQQEGIARKQLAEMNRFRSDFFSQVAHDLRSPLTSISWSARNLLDGVTGELQEKQRQYVEGMAAAAEQLVRLVNNLLEIARMEQQQTKLQLEAVQLDAVLEEATTRLTAVASAKEVRFDVEVDPGLGPVSGNHGKMLEIVDNLLDNAVRFSPPGQVVEITLAREAAGRQCLTVRDHGPGIAEANPERVFEAYHQGQPSPYSTQQGFGLGLHVVKTYIELMGGTVCARNHSGGGALFVCALTDWTNHGGES